MNSRWERFLTIINTLKLITISLSGVLIKDIKKAVEGYPFFVKLLTVILVIFTFFLSEPLYHTQDLSSLSLSFISVSFAWAIALSVFQSNFQVGIEIASKFSTALSDFFDKLSMRHPDEFQLKKSERELINSVLPYIIRHSFPYILSTMVMRGFMDSINSIIFSLLAIATNQLPASFMFYKYSITTSFYNYSFATFFFSMSLIYTFRMFIPGFVRILIGAIDSKLEAEKILDSDPKIVSLLNSMGTKNETEEEIAVSEALSSETK